MPRFVWGYVEVQRLIRLAKLNLSLDEIARRFGNQISRDSLDLALWTKCGRSIPDTVTILNTIPWWQT